MLLNRFNKDAVRGLRDAGINSEVRVYDAKTGI